MTSKALVLITILSSQLLKADLIANVAATAGPPLWSYTVFNNEQANSPNFISSFSLTVNAPITVTSTPTGWDASTDNATFVFWFNTDLALPYSHDIAPGASLAGFSLSSTTTSSQLLSYGLSGWDHSADQPGPTTAGSVLAPSAAAVPEPATVPLVGLSVLSLIIWRRCSYPTPGFVANG